MSKFDSNLIVIGAGSAGLVTSYIAAAVRARVTLIEKDKMGGDCLNTGCVPSKALIRSARLLNDIKRHREFGLSSAEATFDFAHIMERVQRVIKTIEPHDSPERYRQLGVDVRLGRARLVDAHTVEIDGRERITARAIVLATGARPFVPPIKGLSEVPFLTSDNLWQMRTLPDRLVVLGGGPIGCELTQAFARFGSQVSLVEMGPQVMAREDDDVIDLVSRRFEAEGVQLHLQSKATEVVVEGGKKFLIIDQAGQTERIEFDQLLVAVGRRANTEGFGADELGLKVAAQGTFEVNPYLQTNFKNIFACGDVAGPFQFTHTAAHQAWYAAVNALFAPLKRQVDYSLIPWCTYTDPEVARAGLNEKDAKEKNIPHEVTIYPISDLDRAIVEEEATGFIKVLTVPGKDQILGVTIVGHHAGDLIAEYVLAMKHGLGLNKILGTIHVYPTLAEANKFAAGEWKRSHAPQGILNLLEKFHNFRR